MQIRKIIQSFSIRLNTTKVASYLFFSDLFLTNGGNLSDKSFSQKMVYSIYDVMGRKIIEKEISNESSSFDINLENYPKGIYLLNVTTGETKVVKKLVVK